MKKVLLLAITACMGMVSYAQNALNLHPTTNLGNDLTYVSSTKELRFNENLAAKSTALSDTTTTLTAAQYDSIMTHSLLYYLSGDNVYDSGFIFGMNPLGLTAFSDWYQGIYGVDTTLHIIGVQTAFGGTVVSTGKQINIRIWKNDTTHVQRSAHTYFRDFPSSAAPYGSMTLNMENLGIGGASAPDTIKTWFFPTAITGVADNFHVGYDMTYTWGSTGGDTIGVHSTRVGSGWGAGFYTMQGQDTIVFAQTCVKDPSGWSDVLEYGIGQVNISIVPLIQFESTVGVHGLRNRSLTMYNNYPNPAVNNTNIRFALTQNSDVSIRITDITGKVIKTIDQTNLSAGDHTVNVETADWAAGNYIYTITTKAGGAIACMFTVAK